jgi:aminopeptidase N
VHEGFTNYSETLFVDCQYGTKAGDEYCRGTRRNIRNDKPIIAPYDVNAEGSGDMYYKGGNMLHTIRCIIGNDETFRQILRGLNKTFYHQTVTTKQVEDYMTQRSGMDLSKVFDEYLRTTSIPTLTYSVKDGQTTYHWTTCVDGFNMPVRIDLPDGTTKLLQVTTAPSQATLPGDLKVDPNMFVNVKAE